MYRVVVVVIRRRLIQRRLRRLIRRRLRHPRRRPLRKSSVRVRRVERKSRIVLNIVWRRVLLVVRVIGRVGIMRRIRRISTASGRVVVRGVAIRGSGVSHRPPTVMLHPAKDVGQQPHKRCPKSTQLFSTNAPVVF